MTSRSFWTLSRDHAICRRSSIFPHKPVGHFIPAPVNYKLTMGISGIVSCRFNAAPCNGSRKIKRPQWKFPLGFRVTVLSGKNTLDKIRKILFFFFFPLNIKEKSAGGRSPEIHFSRRFQTFGRFWGCWLLCQKRKTSRTEESCLRGEWSQANVHLTMAEEMTEQVPLRPGWADGENVGYMCLEGLLPECGRWLFCTCSYWGLLVLDLKNQSTSPKSEPLTTMYFPFCLGC